jgi:group I intron endonuclease
MKMKLMMKNNIVYKVTNLETEEVYVGITTKSIKDRKKDHLKKSKKGKSYAFQNAITTFGADAFKWEQIDTATTTNELAQKEKEYILEYNSKEQGYNSDSGGGIQKTVYQYDILTGVLVNKYSNLTDASATVGLTKQDLSKVCLSVNKVSNGYVWTYSSTFPKHINDNRRKVVQQFSLEGKFVNEFKSVSEASKLTGCNKTSIAKVCRGERQSCGGFSWKFKN